MTDTELLAKVYWAVCDWARRHPERLELDVATRLELQSAVLASVTARERLRAATVLGEHVRTGCVKRTDAV